MVAHFSIGILAHFPISIYTRVKKGYLPRLIRKLISLSSIKPNLTAISRRRKRLLILPKYVYLKKHDVVTGLIKAAKDNDLDFAVDVYPYYGSDADVALTAGYDVRHGLIGAGVYASHGYERSHKDGVKNTFELLRTYLD